MSRRVQVVCVVCIILVIAGVYRFASSQSPRSKQLGQVTRLFNESRSHLEEVLGYPLPAEPEFRIVSLKDLNKLPGWDTYAFITWRFPGLDKATRQKNWRTASHVVNMATVARHIEGTKTIVVVPENLESISEWDESLKNVTNPRFLQLELVHAAARLALENKHELLDPQYDVRSLEEFQISQAMLEGRAQWATYQVAKRLRCDEIFPLLARRWSHVPDVAPDPRLRATVEKVLSQKHWSYTRGKEFFDVCHKAKVADVEEIALTRMPTQLSWIEEPARYLAYAKENSEPLRTLFANLKPANPAGLTTAMQQPFTPQMLERVASMLKMSKRVEKIVDGWQEGRSLIWSDPQQPEKYVAASIVRFSSDKLARSYFGFAVDLQRKRDEVAGKSVASPFPVLNSEFVPANAEGFDEAIQNNKSVQTTPNGLRMPQSVFLGRHGNMVIEVNCYGVQSDATWTSDFCRTIVERSHHP